MIHSFITSILTSKVFKQKYPFHTPKIQRKEKSIPLNRSVQTGTADTESIDNR